MAPGDHLTLAANESYWGPKPRIGGLVFRPLVENATRVSALKAGEVQVINAVPIDALTDIRADKRLQVVSTASTRSIGLLMRTQRPPFNELRVRQAVAHAMDPHLLTSRIFEGTAVPANAPLAPNVFGAFSKLPPYRFDTAQSRALLAEAGFPNGVTVKYGIPLGNYLEDKQVGEAVAGMLENAGIHVPGFEEVDWPTFFPAAVNGKKYDIYLYGLGSADPSTLLYFETLPLYHDWSPPQVPDLLAATAAGPLARSVAPIQQLQQLLWKDLPWVFLYYQPQILATATPVSGVPARADEFLDFRDATMGR
jgi:peptide/nickel transport system substrate-binding protein